MFIFQNTIENTAWSRGCKLRCQKGSYLLNINYERFLSWMLLAPEGALPSVEPKIWGGGLSNRKRRCQFHPCPSAAALLIFLREELRAQQIPLPQRLPRKDSLGFIQPVCFHSPSKQLWCSKAAPALEWRGRPLFSMGDSKVRQQKQWCLCLCVCVCLEKTMTTNTTPLEVVKLFRPTMSFLSRRDESSIVRPSLEETPTLSPVAAPSCSDNPHCPAQLHNVVLVASLAQEQGSLKLPFCELQ